jgi:hypothetical protein
MEPKSNVPHGVSSTLWSAWMTLYQIAPVVVPLLDAELMRISVESDEGEQLRQRVLEYF